MAFLGKEFESLGLPHAVAILSNPRDVCRAKNLFCKIALSGNGYLCQLVEMSTLHEWKNPAKVDTAEGRLLLEIWP